MRSSTSSPSSSAARAPGRSRTRYTAIILLYCTRLASEPTVLAILMAEKMSGTSVKIIKNEVGCRDDTVPKTVETRRHCEED